MNGRVVGAKASLSCVFLAAVLSACASAGPTALPVACPKVGFLYGLHLVDTLAVEGRNFPVHAELTGLEGSCAYSDSGLDLDYRFDLRVWPTAPVPLDALPVAYFVAVLDGKGEVLDKQRFFAQVPVGRPGQRTGSREHLRQTLLAVDGRNGPAYRIVIGFDLPPDDALARWEARDL